MKKTLTILLTILSISTLFAQIELTDENAESKLLINNDRLIVLDFYATWCGPCKRMAPIIKELAKEYPNVDFYKIDVDKNTVDDALGIEAMPTYLFIKNSTNLEQIEGAMSKQRMESLIKKHMSSSTPSENVAENDYYNPALNHGKSNEFSDENINNIKDSWVNLNALAWHAFEAHDTIDILLKSIELANMSIEIDKNYYNTDTLAALYYKTGNYKQALKKAKEAVDIAKAQNIDYASTTNLIENIIDKM